MPKIVVTQDLGLSQSAKDDLRGLGEVEFYDTFADSYDQWFERCESADIICSGKFGLKQKWRELSDVFISVPFVGIGWFDADEARKNRVVLANSPGCNKEPVAEWIIGMMINLFRDLPARINAQEVSTNSTTSLAGKRVCIAGAGNIGTLVGKICEAFDMEVVYFRRGDDFVQATRNADVIVDALSLNQETRKIYDDAFFQGLKKGSYFITVTSDELWDVDAMLQALDDGILAGVANDSGGIQVDDTKAPIYRKLSSHPKVFATAHTAYNTDRRNTMCNEMMIQNIRDWLGVGEE